jgi:signal peptidase I
MIRIVFAAVLLVSPFTHAPLAQEGRTYRVQSASMLPTMEVGAVFRHVRYNQIKDVKYGDVIVYLSGPSNPSLYAKRVVGLPGDEILVRDGLLYLNGRPVPRIRMGDFSLREENVRVAQYEETLPNGSKYRVLDTVPDGAFDNVGAYKVPLDHYFVIGDNRDNSIDSRESRHGYVPARNILGRAAW